MDDVKEGINFCSVGSKARKPCYNTNYAQVLGVFTRHPSRFAQIERWGWGVFKGNKKESIMLLMPDTNLWTRMLP
jgi:hypothetical protein